MNKKEITRILTLFVVVLVFFSLLFSTQDNEYLNDNCRTKINHHYEILSNSETYFGLEINDLPGSSNNWEWAKSQGICSGNGTFEHPYIIKDKTFSTSTNGDCLLIKNSIVYFEIINCTFSNSGFLKAGLYLERVSNGTILNNTFYNNFKGLYSYLSTYLNISQNNLKNNNDGLVLTWSEDIIITKNLIGENTHFGIIFEDCYNFLISDNLIYYNGGDGIFLVSGGNNNITENDIIGNKNSGINTAGFGIQNIIVNNVVKDNKGYGISSGADYEEITDNIVINNSYSGISVISSEFSRIINNSITENRGSGIGMYYSENSLISGNKILLNYQDGISLSYESDYNNFTKNIIAENGRKGINSYDGYNWQNNDHNLLYNNYIIRNLGGNAKDDGRYNYWNNSIIGNYWDDYTGIDTIPPFGIGDKPYNISGSGGSKDYLPLMEYLYEEDTYEENDEFTSAYDISSFKNRWLNFLDGYSVQFDEDWYEIYITPGEEHLIVDLRFNNIFGNIDLEVYDDSGILSITGSYSNTDNEYIDYLVPSSGIYYLRVYGEDLGNLYKLLWDITPTPKDDNYEENDDPTSAYNFSSNENTWLSSIDGFGVQTDEDWYEIYVSLGEERLIVDLEFIHTEGDIDIEVYDGSGVLLIVGNYSNSDDEIIYYVLPSSGTYFIRIYGEDQGNNYDLFWTTDSIEPLPGFFTLYTNADSIEDDGTFTLSWDASSYADNYSVFVSNSEITTIDSSCSEIAIGLEILYHNITGLSTGEYYYIVVAYNEYGNATSNCINIVVKDPTNIPPNGNDDDDDDDEDDVSIPGFDLYLISIIISIVSTSLIVIIKRRII